MPPSVGVRLQTTKMIAMIWRKRDARVTLEWNPDEHAESVTRRPSKATVNAVANARMTIRFPKCDEFAVMRSERLLAHQRT